MVYIPKNGNGDGTTEDDPSKKQPKRRRQRHRSKSRHSKNGDSGTGDNNTPDSAEDNPLQQDSAQEDGKASPDERAADREVEDDNYMPPFEDEASLDDVEFVVVEACLVSGGRHVIIVLYLFVCRSLVRAGFSILLC